MRKIPVRGSNPSHHPHVHTHQHPHIQTDKRSDLIIQVQRHITGTEHRDVRT